MTSKEWLTRCAARLRSQLSAKTSDDFVAELARCCLEYEVYGISESPEDAADMWLHGGE